MWVLPSRLVILAIVLLIIALLVGCSSVGYTDRKVEHLDDQGKVTRVEFFCEVESRAFLQDSAVANLRAQVCGEKPGELGIDAMQRKGDVEMIRAGVGAAVEAALKSQGVR